MGRPYKAPGELYEFEEWRRRYRKLQDIADRVAAYRTKRARKACADAGLDPNLLGIHPHNAMVSLEYGKPWPGIDYSKVRLCLRIQRQTFEGSRIVERWDKRVRGIKGN